MFKNYFQGVHGIATYPMFSLVVFFVFFVAMTIWIMRADKKHLEEMSELPLQDSDSIHQNQ